ncbi:bifunctional purine biosynthesis protein PurH [Candidatus Blochmanniella vafra str. BVAF]|uniref:Bifunctional purine biosynthesis protein PurH n=1 Tax=Blochmanniella vafra (strain BVAF) TaxID=859654 RepID=E8Q6G6_BLOVB|nr:bifunctional phosphoribosylaminoimidazolecarboxamide formyltransferase/IMP cyclohydrolase [Candidatus Blochmannia vafer]ADV33935.1 bifunctional purine biosynthesis protein PurH [Candidatus Blochmannia vafer str. BVAF]
MSSLLPIHQALISVFNKSELLNFSRALFKQGVCLISTEGTAHMLSNAGVTTHPVSNYTKLPELMNGRVKTLHHKISAGILNRKGIDDTIMHKYNIKPIDMIVVNFYPLNEILKKNNNYDLDKMLNHIDIGGPNMVRAAVKNYKNKVVIIDHNDYNNILSEMAIYNGSISLKTRFILAKKAFRYITQYDSAILDYFNNDTLHKYLHQPVLNSTHKYIHYSNKSPFPNTMNCMNLKFIKKQNMRYGENPHQRAALYQEAQYAQQKMIGTVITSKQLQGKPLSYNNITDIDTALECVKLFTQPTCVIVKHTNPCGVATAHTINDAYHKAYQADPISAFGGIIAFNQPLKDEKTAQSIINQHFIEAIIAPDINQNCLQILSKKQNIRVLKSGMWQNPNTSSLNITNNNNIDFKKISGGLLVQDYNQNCINDLQNLEIVTTTHPTDQEMQDLLFCWKIVKFVKSNAIVCGKNYQTTGIGTGQMNRVFAVKIATDLQPRHSSINVKGSVLASDAFFPFTDGIHVAAQMGIRGIIQPGGSIKDKEIINTANNYKIAMIFTHVRHFRH